MSSCDKVCVICFEEVSIKKSLSYDPVNDQVEGYEDLGNCGRSKNPANHALVFMVKGLYTNWKQPFAYMLSSGPVKSETLHILLQESIACLLQIGPCPKAIVCDQGSNNRAVLKKMNVTTPNPFVISNDSHKTYVFMDPPHLKKNIRNNLKTHGFT
ncbi:THAP domain-containing protein 9 [Plakobranchus ocellatus]|uniref:THAP domain-containing protein 9 n=1 Tax=Plakobranchus ocellatus TaxID=259542 RepID=A0AAV4CBE4_9GAST|nr:THAP domain-containing protein 9 [Plakobranchus ocellatus]